MAGFETRDQEGDELDLEDVLAMLARHHGNARDTEASCGALDLALGELRLTPSVSMLARNHGIHRTIAAADQPRAGGGVRRPTHLRSPTSS